MAKLVILAGPNGAGKSTCAARVLRSVYRVESYVNADVIAQGLSGFAAESAALEAGAIMLERLRSLADARADFAFETTLAGRTFAPWIRQLLNSGYSLQLLYLWLPNPDMAIERVAERVGRGGHNVPEATIRRRYLAGARNFFQLYRPLAEAWQIYDNSSSQPRIIAVGAGIHAMRIADRPLWQAFQGLGAT